MKTYKQKSPFIIGREENVYVKQKLSDAKVGPVQSLLLSG